MAVPALLPAYLIVGEDQLKRETAVSRLKARLNDDLSAFNLDERMSSAGLDPNDIAMSLSTLPVGDGFRLVLIHDAGKLAKAVSETLVSYLENPTPGCVLCLETVKLAKNTRLYKAVQKVGKRAVIDCAPLKVRDLPNYLVRHGAAMGLTVNADAAAELVSRVGENTVLLDQQLSTLMALCPSHVVTVEDVRRHVARTAEVKPWEFLDTVSVGNTARALELYRHMGDRSPLGLMTLLERRLRDMICAHALMARNGARLHDVAQALGRQDWQVRTAYSGARRYREGQLESCLARCAQCERDIKAGKDAETTFTSLVVFICNPS